MARLKLRDRDALLTKEGIIFRVYGYSHPSDAHVCDVEYAPATIFKSTNPKAFRAKGKQVYYKFYADEGLRFVQQKYPRYTILYEPLQERLVGVHREHIVKTRKPNERLQRLMETPPRDELLHALQKVLSLVMARSELTRNNFGVFGSLLHGFYHPKLSDLDLTVYGGEKLRRLREMLEELYREGASLRNEFESEEAIKGKRWKFLNYSPGEYLWHQRRKMVYALFEDRESGRVIKTEFEPVKDWREIRNEYRTDTRILRRGWVKAVARITDDREAPFMPSAYPIELLEVLEGEKVEDIQRVLSYVEEFRMQARRDEEVYVEGNLEQVTTSTKAFHQITLTYGLRYYEQVLKTIRA